MTQEISEKGCVMCLIRYRTTTTDEHLKETGGKAETHLLEIWENSSIKLVWKTQNELYLKKRLLPVKTNTVKKTFYTVLNRLCYWSCLWNEATIATAPCSTVSTPQHHHCCLWAFVSVWISVSVINNHCWAEGELSQQHLSPWHWWTWVYSLTLLLPVFKYKIFDINKNPGCIFNRGGVYTSTVMFD